MKSDNQKVTVSNDSIDIETSEIADEGLLLEKQLLNNSMKQLDSLFINHPVQCKQKNAKDSIAYRKQGNDIYCTKNHNTDKHHKIWNLYTQSIAAAPNDSEELALAYGNRSALLFHLKEYEECIKDCDQGIKITSSDFLKAKLLFRKIESLVALENETANSACQEALISFNQFEFNADIKSKFIEKINGILDSTTTKTFEKKKEEKKEEEYPTFTRQTEAPCASTAVSIKYDKKWGRHIVANQRIEPGEILAIEKSYLTSICLDGMYLFCSNCVQQTWASIPCEGCIYNIYCSEECKSHAWKKYHKFECPVLSYLYNLELDIYPFISRYELDKSKIFIRALAAALRLLLITVHEAGSISKIRKELIAIENCEDPRIKGFSSDGIFESEKCRSVYSLTTTRDYLHNDALGVFVTMVCIATYHLAKESTFFGKKIKATPKEMMLNEDIKLIGALLLKNTLLLPSNTLKYFVHRDSTILGQRYGAALYPFCSLFNHSCDPNVKSIPTQQNERIVYAKRVIEEGEQLFLCYVGDNYTSSCKAERIDTLEATYRFECECIACKENWPTTLPFVKDILKKSSKLRPKLGNKYKHMEKLKKYVMSNLQSNSFQYDPNMMTSVKKLMKEHAENITVRSMDYEMFEHFIYMMLVNGFGTWLNIPETC